MPIDNTINISPLPELLYERSESNSVIVDNNLYVFFGFNYPKNRWLKCIEVQPNHWNELIYDDCDFCEIKSFGLLVYNNKDIIIVGGNMKRYNKIFSMNKNNNCFISFNIEDNHLSQMSYETSNNNRRYNDDKKYEATFSAIPILLQ